MAHLAARSVRFSSHCTVILTVMALALCAGAPLVAPLPLAAEWGGTIEGVTVGWRAAPGEAAAVTADVTARATAAEGRVAALEARVAALEAASAAQQLAVGRLLALAPRFAGVSTGADELDLAAAAPPPSQMQQHHHQQRQQQQQQKQQQQQQQQESFRLSVCIAIPCIPRHLSSLRLVLADIAKQTVRVRISTGVAPQYLAGEMMLCMCCVTVRVCVCACVCLFFMRSCACAAVAASVHCATQVAPAEVVVALSQTTTGDAAALERSFAAAFGFRVASARGAASGAAVGGEYVLPPALTILPTLAEQSHAENNNRAAGACTSDVVSWFDADDRMHPRRTEVKPFNVAVVW